jgi:hypothetical protein
MGLLALARWKSHAKARLRDKVFGSERRSPSHTFKGQLAKALRLTADDPQEIFDHK